MALSSSDLTQVRREIERYIRQFPPPGTGLTAPVAATDIGAGSVDNTEFGYLNGVTSAIQTQIDAKQASDSDLTTIAGLTPSNDDFMQRKAGAWANRTVAQVKTDLSLTGTNSGDQTITLTGDVTGSGTGSFAATIENDAVTYAKMQNASTGNVIIARAAATSGDLSEVAIGASQIAGRGSAGDIAAITLGTNLTMSGTTLNAAGGSGLTSAQAMAITALGAV